MHSILLTTVVLYAGLPVVYASDDIQSNKLYEIPVRTPALTSLQATFKTISPNGKKPFGSYRGVCPSIPVALTDSDFGDGQYILQAGFAEGESLGATYIVPEDQFPIKVDVIEVLFGTSNASQQTTTKWSVTVWDGTPTNGIQVASYASDDVILPHLVMPPGTNGVVISVSVDPDDPDQIYIYNDSGMNSFTVAFKVVEHNNPGSPCITSPPTSSNAFPCTDIGGLQFPNQNWIQAISGPLCVCGSGWMTFQEFPSICTPTGDWVLRSAYTPVTCSVDPVACCFSDNTCTDATPSDCAIFGGTASAEGTSCATYTCGSGDGACCVESTGNCVEFDLNTCLVVGGVHMGEGTTCSTVTCFPEGACCLDDGNCIGPVSPDDCLAVAGSFQGNGVTCNAAECPQPIGACCGPDWCLELTEEDCGAVGATWSNADTTCADEGVCQSDCVEDLNGDGLINVSDLLEVVGEWGSTQSSADIDNSGVVDTGDLLAVIAAWGQCE